MARMSSVAIENQISRSYDVGFRLEEGVLFGIIVLTILFQSWNPTLSGSSFLSWSSIRWGLSILLAAHGIIQVGLFDGNSKASLRVGSALWWCIAFLVVSLGSGLSGDWSAVAREVIRGSRLSSLALFLAMTIFMKRSSAHRLVAVIVWIAVFFSLLATLEFLGFADFLSLRDRLGLVETGKLFEYYLDNRVSILWSNAPTFGSFMALVIPLCLYRIWTAKGQRDALAGYIQLGCLVLGLLMSGSRGPVASAVLVTVLFVLWGRSRQRWMTLLGILLLSSLGWWVISDSPISSTGAFERLANFDPSSTGRLLLWEEAWDKYIVHDWFWGIGYGEWWRLYGWNSAYSQFLSGTRVLHSFYLTTLVEIGLKGLLVEIAFLGVLFWKTMRLPAATSASGDLSLMQRAFFLSMLAMALSSVFDSPLMTAPFMYLYFGFAGILWHGNQWSA